MFRTITPILSIAIGLVIFFFFTQPMLAEIKTIEAETAEYKEAVGIAQTLNETLNTLLEKKRSFSASDVERLEALVPDSYDGVRILADINKIVGSHYMVLSDISLEESDMIQDRNIPSTDLISYDTFKTAEINFSVIGTYEQFKGLLGDIEQSIVLMEVTNIDFGVGEANTLQFNVTVKVFALPSA